MRYLSIVFAAFLLAACGSALVTRDESGAVSPAQSPKSESQNAPADSIIQFLLTSAVTDFHTHGPIQPVRFRHVQIGHFVSPGGEVQYMLCGEFLPTTEGGKDEWTPFTTIRTSGYEQMIGSQASAMCNGTSVTWDNTDDLSSMLQSRFDSLQ